MPIGEGPGGGGGGGGYVYEGEGMEYGMWDEGMDEGYYGEPEDVEEQLKALFSRFDANHDEQLDVTELRAALQAQLTLTAVPEPEPEPEPLRDSGPNLALTLLLL